MSDRIVISKGSKFKIIPIQKVEQLVNDCSWCCKNEPYRSRLFAVGEELICAGCHQRLWQASEEMYLALCKAYEALNLIERHKVGDTDSYAIASQVGKAINAAVTGN